jgi:hypothetical protein
MGRTPNQDIPYVLQYRDVGASIVVVDESMRICLDKFVAEEEVMAAELSQTRNKRSVKIKNCKDLHTKCYIPDNQHME